jgi:hypothetical protein
MTSKEKWQFTNRVISDNSYETYLELGTSDIFRPGCTFYNIVCPKKVSVDIGARSHYQMSFRDFFRDLDAGVLDNEKRSHRTVQTQPVLYNYDCIFNGVTPTSHTDTKDCMNSSLKVLNNKGSLIFPYVDPLSKSWQTEGKDRHPEWIGPVWKSMVEIHYNPTALVDVVIVHNHNNPDGITHGLAIIRKIDPRNKQLVDIKKKLCQSFSDKFLTFKLYESNKREIMNIVNMNTFFDKYGTFEDHMSASYKFWSKK